MRARREEEHLGVASPELKAGVRRSRRAAMLGFVRSNLVAIAKTTNAPQSEELLEVAYETETPPPGKKRKRRWPGEEGTSW